MCIVLPNLYVIDLFESSIGCHLPRLEITSRLYCVSLSILTPRSNVQPRRFKSLNIWYLQNYNWMAGNHLDPAQMDHQRIGAMLSPISPRTKKSSHVSSFRQYTCVPYYFWSHVKDREVICVDPLVQTYENSIISSWWIPNERDLAPECRHYSCHSKTQSLGSIKLIPQSQWAVFSEGGLQWVQLYIIILKHSWSEYIIE